LRTFESFAAQGRDNNLNLLRMIAASAVLVSHAYPLALGHGPEPLEQVTPTTLGGAAVGIFFALSGFLITSSFVRRRSLLDFAVARAARLLPGMIAMYVAVAFIAAPFFTMLGPADYFASPRLYADLLRVPLLIDVSMPLPGVFAANPVPVVNGSLWSLPYEVACYGVTALAGLIGLLTIRRFSICFAIGAALLVMGRVLGLPAADKHSFMLIIPFALGALFFLCRRYVPLSVWGVVLLIALTALARSSVFYRELYFVTLSYGAFWLGGLQWRALGAYNRLGDFSFGIYIYAWPVQEMIVALLPGIGPGRLIAIAWPVTLLPAIASWYLIEHPALLHRHRIGTWLASRFKTARGKDQAGDTV
jgi:peptidoglycan/LPS O-acetylase OafA/YrhL